MKMGQEEIQKTLEKENLITIHELHKKTGIGKRSLRQSLARMRDNDEVIIIRIKKRFFYINKEIKCHI